MFEFSLIGSQVVGTKRASLNLLACLDFETIFSLLFRRQRDDGFVSPLLRVSRFTRSSGRYLILVVTHTCFLNGLIYNRGLAL